MSLYVTIQTWLKKALAGKVAPARTTTTSATGPNARPTRDSTPKIVDPGPAPGGPLMGPWWALLNTAPFAKSKLNEISIQPRS